MTGGPLGQSPMDNLKKDIMVNKIGDKKKNGLVIMAAILPVTSPINHVCSEEGVHRQIHCRNNSPVTGDTGLARVPNHKHIFEIKQNGGTN